MITASESKNKLSRSSNSIDGELMKALILFRQLEKSFNAGKLYLILYSVVRTYFGISGIWIKRTHAFWCLNSFLVLLSLLIFIYVLKLYLLKLDIKGQKVLICFQQLKSISTSHIFLGFFNEFQVQGNLSRTFF